jgi:hypothetical protein
LRVEEGTDPLVIRCGIEQKEDLLTTVKDGRETFAGVR